MHFKYKVVKFILTHTFLVLVTIGLGHGIYRKLYTVIGGQRAEKFERTTALNELDTWTRTLGNRRVNFFFWRAGMIKDLHSIV